MPDAPQFWGYTYSWTYPRPKCVLLIPLTKSGEDGKRLTSRGGYPTWGSGPYFMAHARSVPRRLDGAELPIDTYYEYESGGMKFYERAEGSVYETKAPSPYGGSTYWYYRREFMYSIPEFDIEPNRYRMHWKVKEKPNAFYEIYNEYELDEIVYTRYVWGNPGMYQYTTSEIKYLKNEYTTFDAWCSLGVYLGPYAGLWAEAYSQAVSTLPEIQTNMLENAVQAFEAVRDVFSIIASHNPVEALIKAVNQLADPRKAWLTYRYQVKTTELDLTEVQRGVAAINAFKALTSQRYSVTGKACADGIQCRSDVTFAIADLVPQTYWDVFKRYGFDPSAANLWDMVPLSFVVDWFLQVGPILEHFGNALDALRVEPLGCWYSARTEYNGQFIYFRIPGRRLDLLPAYKNVKVNGKTVKMRIADAISIFT